MNSPVKKVGLIVRSGPFKGRSSRDQLDLALAAASLELPLEVFFVGEGVLQLRADRDPRAARLPGGIKGWKALPDLTSVNAWVADTAMTDVLSPAAELLLEVKVVSEAELAGRLASCDLAMVI